MEVFRSWDFREIAKSGEEIDEFGEGLGALSFLLSGSNNDQRDFRGYFVGGVLTPFAVVAEVVSVISPEDDDGVLGKTVFFKALNQSSDLRVHVADAGAVAMNEFARFSIVESLGLFGNVGIVFQFTPAGTIIGKSVDGLVA